MVSNNNITMTINTLFVKYYVSPINYSYQIHEINLPYIYIEQYLFQILQVYLDCKNIVAMDKKISRKLQSLSVESENTQKIAPKGKSLPLFKRFLDECKLRIKQSEVTICLGSEACDPDSFVCSLILSIHENVIPVVNMTRKVFESKGDLQYLCSIFNISNDDLIFLERPKGSFSLQARILGSCFRVEDESYKLEGKKIKLMLVDHHRPVEELQHLEIDMIIDHHLLSEASLKARRIYIDIDAGSCCTLLSKFVGHSLMTRKHSKNAFFNDKSQCRNVAKMLSIPILLDTNRFKKVTSHFDRGEFRKLIKIAGVEKKDIKKIVKRIKKVRLNDSKLDNETILLKDFKKFHKDDVVFGYSTVKYRYEDWIDRETKGSDKKNSGILFETELNEFRRDYGLDFLLVNRKKKDERFLIMVNCPFEKKLATSQGFEPMEYKGVKFYSVSPEKTRKILAPIIKDMIHKINHS